MSIFDFMGIKQDKKPPSRRDRGEYFTKWQLALKTANIVKKLDFNYIIEPYCGEGALIQHFFEDYEGVANDINEKFTQKLRGYDDEKWKITNYDVINSTTKELIEKWGITGDRKLMIFTNPPYHLGLK